MRLALSTLFKSRSASIIAPSNYASLLLKMPEICRRVSVNNISMRRSGSTRNLKWSAKPSKQLRKVLINRKPNGTDRPEKSSVQVRSKPTWRHRIRLRSRVRSSLLVRPLNSKSTRRAAWQSFSTTSISAKNNSIICPERHKFHQLGKLRSTGSTVQ